MMGRKLALAAVGLALAGGTGAHAAKIAISCTGESVQDIKSFNLPPKAAQETRTYILDDGANTVALFNADHEAVPLCDKAQPACHTFFQPGGITIGFQGDGEMLKLSYDRSAGTIGVQSDNAAMTTTFQGKCQPVDPTAK